MVHETERPRADPAILYRELRTGCVLYHPDTNEAHVLNLTAAYIWTCCDGKMDVPAIAAQVAKVCRLSLSEALRDVKKALREFHAKKLLL
ncbi:MAG: PqqD family protein [candidate division NC10 bacterium]|nr:PqqD family protein [candidate division NC10 bacterium]